MKHMLCRNRVKDYDKWRVIFDSNKKAGEDAGLKLLNIWHDNDDMNNIFFLFEIESKERALEFMNTPEAAEAGRISGVLDGECHFLSEV